MGLRLPRSMFVVSLMLPVGCAGARPAGDGESALEATRDLGPEFDAVWSDLMVLWRETGAYAPGEVRADALDAARFRLDDLLERLERIDLGAAGAPGLATLVRVEFAERLDVAPAEAPCPEMPPPRTRAGEAYDRIAARAAAVERLAAAGYLDGWLRTVTLARMRDDVAAVRRAMAEGDSWRTEDPRLRLLDPREVEETPARAEAALAILERL